MHVVIGYWRKDYGLNSIQSEQRTKRHAAILGIQGKGSGFADTYVCDQCLWKISRRGTRMRSEV